jgi:hypothetical protein
MKIGHRIVTFSLTLAVAAMLIQPAFAAATLQQYGALERGYRTGYSDGYQLGWSDQLRGASPDARSKTDYQSADRAYIAAYGSIEDYRDGYRQGFEAGYDAGFNRRGFDSEIPAGGISRRGPDSADNSVPVRDPQTQSGVGDAVARRVPSNTVLLVELMTRLSTDVSQRGDRFEARVVEPAEFEGAMVAGRLTNVERPGKAKGRAQLQLDFDQIQMQGGDWTAFSAQVIEVVNRGGDVGDVDSEGGVRGKSTTKDDVTKVGAGAGIGAIIGAIAGGGKGAGIGAIIGASVGTAGVLTQRGKDIRLEPGQQLRIRTSSR